MMKLVIRNVQGGCRLGILTVCENTERVQQLETPFCLLYTRGGSVPYLTRDMVDLLNCVEGSPKVAQMPLTLLSEHEDAIEKYKKGIASFTAMKHYHIYCSLQDSAQAIPTGFNDVAGVSVWGRGGKVKLNEDSFMKIMTSFQPDWYQALCDSDTTQTSSRKRVKRSVDRTLQYLDRCIEKASLIPELKDAELFGVVQGGHFVEERLRSAEETARRPVAGFCLEGFHNFGPETENFSILTIEDLIKQTLAQLPTDKPRLLPGLWSPLDVLRAVRLGVDVFDSTYAYNVTTRNCALVFECCLQNEESTEEIENETGKKQAEIQLRDKRFFDDFDPLVKGCTCYTCVNHTRSYIHHLVVTGELLASTLLMMHNSQHYFNLFRAIRKAIHDDKVDELEQALLRYYPVANQHVAVDSVTNELSSPAINGVQSACLTRDELIN